MRFLPFILLFALTACSLPEDRVRTHSLEPQTRTKSSNPQQEKGSEILTKLRTPPVETSLIGDSNAPVIITLFTEHHCKYCRDFHLEHLTFLQNDFIEKGLVAVRIVPFHIEKYPRSATAGKATLCAKNQERDLDLHLALFNRIGSEREDPRLYAEEMELDMTAFDECMTREETDNMYAGIQEWAKSLDVSLVPTLFINDERITGLPYYADLRGMIREKLN